MKLAEVRWKEQIQPIEGDCGLLEATDGPPGSSCYISDSFILMERIYALPRLPRVSIVNCVDEPL